MQRIRYDRKNANRLSSLLRSIAMEMQERTGALNLLEHRMEMLAADRRPDRDEVSNLVAELATHRRELRQVEKELRNLGCSVVGTEPLTIRIPGRIGNVHRSFVWQQERPTLTEGTTRSGGASAASHGVVEKKHTGQQ